MKPQTNGRSAFPAEPTREFKSHAGHHHSVMTILVALIVLCPVGAYALSGGERISVDLTIYNENLSLIRELRKLDLKKGESTVVLGQIPATIDGTSLHFKSLTDPDGCQDP